MQYKKCILYHTLSWPQSNCLFKRSTSDIMPFWMQPQYNTFNDYVVWLCVRSYKPTLYFFLARLQQLPKQLSAELSLILWLRVVRASILCPKIVIMDLYVALIFSPHALTESGNLDFNFMY